ncbi:MAG: GAF domain-containing protein [Deltaproteobacteria bacterium]|nr:GAF domain-containing protein [Deltaproteobacteria bacterium]
MQAESLTELDGLIVSVLERVIPFQRGFLTYQLPNGDWKLVLFPSGDSWERKHVRDMLHLALRSDHLMTAANSQQDPSLGQALDGLPDSRVLLPLRTDDLTLGAVFLLSRQAPFDHQATDFLSLFGDIAALAILNCARLELSNL